jgi:hypothetical protein
MEIFAESGRRVERHDTAAADSKEEAADTADSVRLFFVMMDPNQRKIIPIDMDAFQASMD